MDQCARPVRRPPLHSLSGSRSPLGVRRVCAAPIRPRCGRSGGTQPYRTFAAGTLNLRASLFSVEVDIFATEIVRPSYVWIADITLYLWAPEASCWCA